MAMQNTGPIALTDIQTEFGGSDPIGLDEYYKGGAYVPNTSTNAGVPTSGQITVDDFYGAAAGSGTVTEDPYYEMHLLRTITGQNGSWQLQIDNIAAYASTKGRIVFSYVNGTSGTSYQGDIQIDDINIPGVTYSFETNSHDWLTSTSNTNGMDPNNLGTFQNFKNSYTTVPTSSSGTRWCRDSGGTPSGGTGLTSASNGSFYLYAETSGSSTGGHKYSTCSPLLQLGSSSSQNLVYYVARLGSNIGTLRVYWAENLTTDPYAGGGGNPGGGFTGSSIALIPRTSFNGSTGSVVGTNNPGQYFWQNNNGYSNFSHANVFGAYPTGPSNGDTCKICIIYRSRNYWRGDFQIDDFYVNATSDTAGGTNTNIDMTGTSGWQQDLTRYSFNNSYAMPSINTVQSQVQNDTFNNMNTGTSTGQWNIDSGGTPSSSTGLGTVGSGNYIYWEASGSGAGYSYKFRPLISREFSINTSSGYGIRCKLGLRGDYFGYCQMYLLWD